MAGPAALPNREQFTFFHALRVRWSELDPQGIVFNPNYFVYFDLAITEYMRAIGFTYPEGFTRAGSDMFAVHAQANFRASARYDDQLEIGVRCERIGRSSFAFELAVYRAEALLVGGALVYVNARVETRAPTQVPEELVQAIVAYERFPPTRS